jgi:hypothetical protein
MSDYPDPAGAAADVDETTFGGRGGRIPPIRLGVGTETKGDGTGGLIIAC